MKDLTILTGTIIIAILISLLATVIVQDYIDWFLHPIFDIPTLTYGQIFGLLSFMSLLSACFKTDYTKKEYENIDILVGVVRKILLLLFAWGLGYIYWLIIY